MKKIVELLKQPYTTTFLCVVGLSSGLLIGIYGSKIIGLQNTELQKVRACNDAYDMMCVQVHACTGNPVSQCDTIIDNNELCKTNLPDLQVIYNCKNELRQIECTDDLPVSCSLFMDVGE